MNNMNNRKHFLRRMIVPVVQLVLIGGVIAWVVRDSPFRQPSTSHVGGKIESLNVGELVRKPGTYESRDRSIRLILSPLESGGKLRAKVLFQEKSSRSSSSFEIDKRKPWFFVLGEDGNVWGYSEDMDSVTSFRRRVTARHGITHATTTAGMGGGWDGIPPKFLKALPERHQKRYERYLESQSKSP